MAGLRRQREQLSESPRFHAVQSGWAYYRTPIDNLYMCGSATHPGGGIMGANGRLASQVILKDSKSRAFRFKAAN